MLGMTLNKPGCGTFDFGRLGLAYDKQRTGISNKAACRHESNRYLGSYSASTKLDGLSVTKGNNEN